MLLDRPRRLQHTKRKWLRLATTRPARLRRPRPSKPTKKLPGRAPPLPHSASRRGSPLLPSSAPRSLPTVADRHEPFAPTPPQSATTTTATRAKPERRDHAGGLVADHLGGLCAPLAPWGRRNPSTRLLSSRRPPPRFPRQIGTQSRNRRTARLTALVPWVPIPLSPPWPLASHPSRRTSGPES